MDIPLQESHTRLHFCQDYFSAEILTYLEIFHLQKQMTTKKIKSFWD